MADRPILFSAPMVRALLSGRKTQTRRLLPIDVPGGYEADVCNYSPTGWVLWRPASAGAARHCTCRPVIGIRWHHGDRLWVREIVAAGTCCDLPPSQWSLSFWRREQGSAANRNGLWYAADGLSPDNPITQRGRRRPGIHMPRWASRLTLTIREVGIERLHDITEEAADAEGVCHFVEQHDPSGSWGELPSADRTRLVHQVYGSSVEAFQHLWESLHGAAAWTANPRVAAISFTVHRASIDALAAGRAA